ncbi:MAG: chorismate mutase [Planctomycetota bacterium]|jgi:chorismate mutase
MVTRGIRGAVRAKRNTRKAVFEGSRKLMRAILRANHVPPEDVAACFFTMTPDLTADFPAYVLREMPKWKNVPILCAQELNIPRMMNRLIRVLILVNTDTPQDRIKHQYLGETSCLRPDLARTNRRKRRRK